MADSEILELGGGCFDLNTVVVRGGFDFNKIAARNVYRDSACAVDVLKN